MNDTTLVDRARESRSSPSVLKLKLSNLRSRHPAAVIFVVEGKDDYSPYEIWLRFSPIDYEWKIQTSEGKGQVLGLRELLSRDRAGLAAGVYFVVDSDYDGLRGHAPGPDIYSTPCYSVENLLVNEDVVASCMTDELRCILDHDCAENALRVFRKALTDFIGLISDECELLYHARKRGIRVVPIDQRAFKKSIKISAGVVRNSKADFSGSIKLMAAVNAADLHVDAAEFQKLSKTDWVRGKFLIEFFYKWLASIEEDRRSAKPTVFKQQRKDIKPLANSTMRSLASRRAVPASFSAFVASCAPP